MTLGIAIVATAKWASSSGNLRRSMVVKFVRALTSASSARNEALSRRTLEGVDVAIEFFNAGRSS